MKYRLNEYPALASFLDNEVAATIAVPIDEKNTIHIASLRFWHETAPLLFYFVTGRKTEKCKMLVKNSSIQGAASVGTYTGTAFTLQMRGIFRIVDPMQFERIVEEYYRKRGNRHDDIRDAANVLIEFSPSWARFTDYSKGYVHYFLDLQ